MSEWIEWNGGEIPVPIGTKIIVKYRCGDEYRGIAGTGNAKRWIHLGLSGDIFAYKILEPITPELYGAVPDPKGHPNASILMEIAKEAAINPKWWKEFEVATYETTIWSIPESMFHLYQCLCDGTDVRRKPRTIRIGNYDVPEPMRIPPKDRSKYYFADLSQDCISELVWADTAFDNYWLEIGLIFETEEGAELMLKALQELLAGKQ